MPPKKKTHVVTLALEAGNAAMVDLGKMLGPTGANMRAVKVEYDVAPANRNALSEAQLEQPLRFVRIERPDVSIGLEVALRDDEHVHGRLRLDVLDREQTVVAVHHGGGQIAACDAAEDASGVAHAARIPSRVMARPRTRSRAPTSPSTSHGE